MSLILQFLTHSHDLSCLTSLTIFTIIKTTEVSIFSSQRVRLELEAHVLVKPIIGDTSCWLVYINFLLSRPFSYSVFHITQNPIAAAIGVAKHSEGSLAY